MEWKKGDYLISTDQGLLDPVLLHHELQRTYWAKTRTLPEVTVSVENSLCFGLYYEQNQIGFARVLTDWATTYLLCDVFVVQQFRGKGLGKWLVSCATGLPEMESMTGMLLTNDAQGLYAKFGFKNLPDGDRFMIKTRKIRARHETPQSDPIAQALQ